MSAFRTLLVGIFVFSVVTTVSAKAKVKPVSSYFHICKRTERSQLNECIKKSIMEAKPLLKKGVPGLGLVPIEPMVIPKMELSEGSGSFALNTTLTNYVIHGLSGYTITNIDVVADKAKPTFNLTLMIPDLKMTADYNMEGQILVIPLRGNGNCELNFTNVVTVGSVDARVVTRDNKEYLDLMSFKWEFQFKGKQRIWFYNLFNGDERLGLATNNFLNNNWEDASQAFKHLPEAAFGELLKDLSKKVFEVYPLNELFIDWD